MHITKIKKVVRTLSPNHILTFFTPYRAAAVIMAVAVLE